MNIEVGVHLCVDSKYFFTSLSSQRNSIHGSIRGDVASITFEFQVGNVNHISWIPGKIKFGGPFNEEGQSAIRSFAIENVYWKTKHRFRQTS